MIFENLRWNSLNCKIKWHRENFLYKKCYSRWWKTAINGEKGDDIDRVDCDVLMQEYQDCVVGHLKQEGQRKSEE